MNLFTTLRRSGGIEALARQINRPSADVAAAAEALLPEVLSCLRSYAVQEGDGEVGINRLLALLDELGGGRLAVDVMGPDKIGRALGHAVLERICEDDRPARLELAEIAASSGIDAGLLEEVQPPLATLVCGYISARVGGSGEQEGLDWLIDLLKVGSRI